MPTMFVAPGSETCPSLPIYLLSFKDFCPRTKGNSSQIVCSEQYTAMETYYTFGNLYKAYLDCKKRKSNTLNHIKFWENLEENLLDLEEKLQNRTYKPGRSIAFVVQKPKLREVFAADFRDRVVHHLLCNYLSPIFERTFIYDSWACRKGKGTHGAMLRLREFARKLSRERETESGTNEISFEGYCPRTTEQIVLSRRVSASNNTVRGAKRRELNNRSILKWTSRVSL